MLFETQLTEYNTVNIRVHADTPEQAQNIFEAFMESDGGEYFQDELDNTGNREWKWGPFDKVSPSRFDECATITKNEDGSFEAMYEGGEE